MEWVWQDGLLVLHLQWYGLGQLLAGDNGFVREFDI